MTRAAAVLALLAAVACLPSQGRPLPTPTPTDLERLCARATPAASDVIGRALEDACLQIQGTPEPRR